MFTIFFSFWRRWFGGGFKNTWLKNNRAVQCIVFIVVNYFLIYDKVDFFDNIYLKYAFIFLIDIYLYAQFWSKGHGCCFDEGRGGKPTQEVIDRYNERWYHYPLDWLLKNHKYGFLYDFLYMFMRYACPMIPLAFIDLNFLYVGMLVSPVYAFCWTIEEREPWIFKKFKYAKSATNLSEYIVGAIYGFML